MKIYTSYYAKSKKLPDDLVRISIAGKAPAGYVGLEYKKVAPKYGFFMEWKKNHDNDFYIEHFEKEVLNVLDAQRVYDDLERLSNGRDCVLLCYEKSGDFCHRHLVADWLNKKLDLNIQEYS